MISQGSGERREVVMKFTQIHPEMKDEIMKYPPKKNIRKPGIKTIGKKDQSDIPKWKPGKTRYKTSYIPGSKWLGPTWWLIPLSKWVITTK